MIDSDSENEYIELEECQRIRNQAEDVIRDIEITLSALIDCLHRSKTPELVQHNWQRISRQMQTLRQADEHLEEAKAYFDISLNQLYLHKKRETEHNVQSD